MKKLGSAKIIFFADRWKGFKSEDGYYRLGKEQLPFFENSPLLHLLLGIFILFILLLSSSFIYLLKEEYKKVVVGNLQAKPETVEKVCKIVRKQLALTDESELTPESKFAALGADSLDTVCNQVYILSLDKHPTFFMRMNHLVC